MSIYYITTALVLFFVVLFFVVFFALRKRKKGHLKDSLKKTLFVVRFPRSAEGDDSKENVNAFIGRMEHVYSQFLSIKERGLWGRFFYGYQSISLEIASTVGGGDISFYIAVPSYKESSFESYVQGAYPEAVLQKKTEDYTIFEPRGFAKVSYLKLKKSKYLPINTYRKMESDPLEAITNALTKIGPDEGSAVQVVMRPAKKSESGKQKRFFDMISKEGKSVKEAHNELEEGLLIKTIKTISDIFSSSEKSDQQKETKESENTLSAVKERVGKPLFEVNIRIVAAAKEEHKSEEVLENIKRSFTHFLSENEFQAIDLKRGGLKKGVYDFSFRNFNKKRVNLLGIEELANIYHFPSSHIKTPYISWEKTKEAAPPSDLPASGPILLGESVFRGERKEVYMASKEDRMRHFYIIGQTGTGKSSIMYNMIRQDILNGEGVGVVDPHGELVEDTLSIIPPERADDVILFEPFDTERPCGLNMLEWSIPEQKDFAVSEMISIFMKLFPPEMVGPMFEHYMRNAMLALAEDKENPGTLVDIPRMFTDESFMKERVSKVTNPVIRGFWLNEWAQTTERTKSDMLGYVVSKIGRFIQNEMMRNIVGQKHSSFNLEDAMNNRKIFLANLSKGMTGEMNSSLLGLIIVSKIYMAAMRRTMMSEERRKDFYLYVDEFQNFTTDSIASILSEARKYRLSLNIGNQYMPQLKQEIKDAVIGNVGTIGSYRVGEEDAVFLENKFQPEFTKSDLSNLDNFQLIVKMIINGNISSPFKINAMPPQKGDPEARKKTKELSKIKYGRLRTDVEEEINKRSGL